MKHKTWHSFLGALQYVKNAQTLQIPTDLAFRLLHFCLWTIPVARRSNGVLIVFSSINCLSIIPSSTFFFHFLLPSRSSSTIAAFFYRSYFLLLSLLSSTLPIFFYYHHFLLLSLLSSTTVLFFYSLNPFLLSRPSFALLTLSMHFYLVSL